MPTARQFGSMLMASGGSVEGPKAAVHDILAKGMVAPEADIGSCPLKHRIWPIVDLAEVHF